MEIELPSSDQETLALLAAQAGFDSVEHYAAACLSEFAQHHAAADLPQMSEKELRSSLAMLDLGMEQAEAGEGLDAREALREIAEKHNLKIDR